MDDSKQLDTKQEESKNDQNSLLGGKSPKNEEKKPGLMLGGGTINGPAINSGGLFSTEKKTEPQKQAPNLFKPLDNSSSNNFISLS